MRTFSVAGLQLNLDYSGNRKLIEEALVVTSQRYPWVDMIIVSELAVGGANRSVDYSLDNQIDGFKEIAKELNIWLVPGSFYDHKPDSITNVAPVISNTGEVITLCIKTYPFLPYEKNILGGNEVCTFEIPNVGIFGMHICYDLWFPETSRAMAMKGAEIILHPSLTDTCDRKEEKIMARATAIQQQCYYLDVNAGGRQGCGQSIFIGPEGEILTEAETGSETLLIEIDLDKVKRVRARGIKGLGQPLKSFRDNPDPFKIREFNSDYLSQLGKLEIPKKD